MRRRPSSWRRSRGRLLGTGDYVLAIATAAASFFILVFAEIIPKVIGAAYAERIALGASYILTPLIPLHPPADVDHQRVRAGARQGAANPPGRGQRRPAPQHGELRTLVLEGGKYIPKKHQSILLNLFDLEDMTVDDTMTPRGQIESLDLKDDIDDIRNTLATAAPHAARGLRGRARQRRSGSCTCARC
jgi:Mg2+/Co2+ transporter CorB